MSIPTINNYDIKQFDTEFPNKARWQLDSTRAVLLIHDLQEYFLDFYAEGSTTKTQVIENIKQLKNWAQQLGIPCIYTAQPADQNPQDRALLTDFWGPGLKDQEKTRIVKALEPNQDDIVVTKWRYSAFKKNNFKDCLDLSNRDQIIICGVYAHIGILATALEAFMFDYQPFVVADAVADFSKSDHEFALNYIATRCGVVKRLKDVINPSVGDNLNAEKITEQVADILFLQPEEIPYSENLQNLGLDSIRLMSLIENWQNEGLNIEFSDMAENMSIAHWVSIINSGVGKSSFKSVNGAV